MAEKKIGIGTKLTVPLPLKWVAELIALDVIPDDTITSYARGFLVENADNGDGNVDAINKTLDAYTVDEIKSSMATSILATGLKEVDVDKEVMLVTMEITDMEAVKTISMKTAKAKNNI